MSIIVLSGIATAMPEDTSAVNHKYRYSVNVYTLTQHILSEVFLQAGDVLSALPE